MRKESKPLGWKSRPVCSIAHHRGALSRYIDNVKNHDKIDAGIERTWYLEEE